MKNGQAWRLAPLRIPFVGPSPMDCRARAGVVRISRARFDCAHFLANGSALWQNRGHCGIGTEHGIVADSCHAAGHQVRRCGHAPKSIPTSLPEIDEPLHSDLVRRRSLQCSSACSTRAEVMGACHTPTLEIRMQTELCDVLADSILEASFTAPSTPPRCGRSSSPKPSSFSSMLQPSLIMRWIRPANCVCSSDLKPQMRNS